MNTTSSFVATPTLSVQSSSPSPRFANCLCARPTTAAAFSRSHSHSRHLAPGLRLRPRARPRGCSTGHVVTLCSHSSSSSSTNSNSIDNTQSPSSPAPVPVSASPTSFSEYSIETLLDHLRSNPLPTPTSTSSASSKASVYLIGTGPGDPGLLTLRALQLMRRATVVLYDRLVSPAILQLLNPDAVLVYVGKESGWHTRTQDEIHLLLSFFASSGSSCTVVRLKGGDPLIFGRGGEELEFLSRLGLQIQTIPGVTAASGIAGQLSLPLTMRGFASSVQYLTGHSAKEGQGVETFGTLNGHTTYVVYMGLGLFHAVKDHMLNNGLTGKVPCVAVQDGTTTRQRVVADYLDDIDTRVKELEFQSPTLFIVGAVVKLSWCWEEERRGKVTEGLFSYGTEEETDTEEELWAGRDDFVMKEYMDLLEQADQTARA